MSPDKPSFRAAEVITESEADEALASGDVDRMRYALIDGSRCLDDAWTLRSALRFLGHEDAQLRWAAAFAIDQARAGMVDEIRSTKSAEILFTLQQAATGDPDSRVRHMVTTIFTDVIIDLLNRLDRV
jgi:hypothetical protein